MPPHRLERLPVAPAGGGGGGVGGARGAALVHGGAGGGERGVEAAAGGGDHGGAEEDGVRGGGQDDGVAGGVGVELAEERAAGVAAGEVQRLDALAVGAELLDDEAEAEGDGDRGAPVEPAEGVEGGVERPGRR